MEGRLQGRNILRIREWMEINEIFAINLHLNLLNVVHVKNYGLPSIICNRPTVFTQSLTKRWTTNFKVTLQHKVAVSGFNQTDPTSDEIIWFGALIIHTLQKDVTDHIQPQTILNIWFLQCASFSWPKTKNWSHPMKLSVVISVQFFVMHLLAKTMWMVNSCNLVYAPTPVVGTDLLLWAARFGLPKHHNNERNYEIYERDYPWLLSIQWCRRCNVLIWRKSGKNLWKRWTTELVASSLPTRSNVEHIDTKTIYQTSVLPVQLVLNKETKDPLTLNEWMVRFCLNSNNVLNN